MGLPKLNFANTDAGAPGKYRQLKAGATYEFEVGGATAHLNEATGDCSLRVKIYAVGEDGHANPEASNLMFLTIPAVNESWQAETGEKHQINIKDATKKFYSLLAATDEEFPRRPGYNPDTQANTDPSTGEVIEKEEAFRQYAAINELTRNRCAQMWQEVEAGGGKNVDTFLTGSRFFGNTKASSNGKYINVNPIIHRGQVDDVEYVNLFQD